MTTKKLSHVIEEYISVNKISLNKLARKADLSHNYVHNLYKGRHADTGKEIEPTMTTLQKLAQAMDMQLVDLLIKCGYLKEADRGVVVESIPEGHIIFDSEEDKERFSPEFLSDLIEVLKKHQM